MKADWTSPICPSCGTRLRTCCNSAIGDSHMTACRKLGPFPELPVRRSRPFPYIRLRHNSQMGE